MDTEQMVNQELNTPKMAPVQPNPTIHSTKNTPMVPVEKKDSSSLIKTIIIIVLFLATATFVGLFIWINSQYIEVSTDVEGQIAAAEAKARHEQEEKDLAQFAEDEKYPLRSFVGPVDYGQLSFEYPKTWSVYVAADASKGGNYEAYLNPLVVEPMSDSTVNALRVSILDKPFDTVAAEYQRELDRKDSNLSVESVTVGGVAANRYTGTIPKTELNGVIVIFAIRDKTVILRTDAMLFINDFDALLSTVQFNA
jgi:hypothetical protein